VTPLPAWKVDLFEALDNRGRGPGWVYQKAPRNPEGTMPQCFHGEKWQDRSACDLCRFREALDRILMLTMCSHISPSSPAGKRLEKIGEYAMNVLYPKYSERGEKVPRARYRVEEQSDDTLFIADVGEGMTVTNDAEAVVRDLHRNGVLGARRLLYRDTLGFVDEIKHDGNGAFRGFAPGVRKS